MIPENWKGTQSFSPDARYWSNFNGSLYHAQFDCPLLLCTSIYPPCPHDPDDPELDSTRSNYVPCEMCCEQSND